jgi:hypothetical protein
MARRLHLSPPLERIMNADPVGTEMVEQFRALMNGPENERLQPFDYVSIALFLFQGAKDQALGPDDAFDVILLAYDKCPAAEQRRQVINDVMAIGNWLPHKIPAAMNAVKRAFESEKDPGLRAYEVTMIQRMERRSFETRPLAREILSRMARDENESVAALAGHILEMMPDPAPAPGMP